MANVNTEYELLAREVYEEILQAEGFDTITIQHDVNIEGKSGQKHQIDVYWELNVAGIKHKVAVECKNYTSPVSVGKVRDFSAALDDIGNIQGIFITKTGYQAGAKIFADHKGITLKHLRQPTNEDLKSAGAPPSLNIRGHIFYFTNTVPDVKFDFNWIIANTSMKEGDPFEIAALNCDINIIDAEGNFVKTFLDLENELPRSTDVLENRTGLTHEYKFDNEYLTWPDCQYEKLKLEKISFQYDVAYTASVTKFEGRWAAKAVLEDIKTGEIHLHKKQGSLA
ncbi:restriction endonuclease [Zhongshania aquimaris]|uniref:Restriction endonuclease n=1 Tax=Zhongshania aquimaris TaxID=2857107 RepID=A0ABS6VVZ7_9GAMM|nr:restriction endonuclease [Zhongshania aquimaris]MBW2942527.1 restriction endonuclease [Zhongshania aquimaris]